MHAGFMERWMGTSMSRLWMKNFKKASGFIVQCISAT